MTREEIGVSRGKRWERRPVCIGCGKEVPEETKDELWKAGWTITDATCSSAEDRRYYQCGCMEVLAYRERMTKMFWSSQPKKE